MSLTKCLPSLIVALAGLMSIEALHAEPGVIRRAGRRIDGVYLVALDGSKAPDAVATAAELSHRQGVATRHVYDTVVRGFSFAGSEAAAMALSRDPRVLWVQEDSLVTADSVVYQTPAPSWGLDRLNQQFSLTLGDNVYSADYTGFGTVIYLIDSGLNPIGSEFGGRVRESHNWAPGPDGLVDPNYTSDCAGHGTSVASLAAGTTYGVAKSATIVNLRVLDCSNAYSDSSTVIAALNWMVADHANSHAAEPAVANMSLGSAYGPDDLLDTAALNAVQSGITVVVSAGNQQIDACTRSPARVGNPYSHPTPTMASVITVGAINSDETFATYSNTGACVDILAPASFLTGMYASGYPGTLGFGTSFGAPLVTGVAALHMQRYGTANNPSMIEGLIKDNGNQNQVTNVPSGTPNLLIYSGIVQHRRACC